MTGAGTVRLFTALWPGPAPRARLAALRDAWRWPPGAKLVPDAKLHATLHFIGSFPAARVEALGDALDAVPVSPLRVRATGSALWRGGIAVATLTEAPELMALQARLGGVLAGLGVALDPRPYRPHVTLARQAHGARPPEVLPALEWRTSGFALVASSGGGYAVLAAWGGGGRVGGGPGGAGFT